MTKSKTTTKSRGRLKRYTVMAVESLSYTAVIHAKDPVAAEEKAAQLWESNSELEVFHFHDNVFEGFYVDEDSP